MLIIEICGFSKATISYHENIFKLNTYVENNILNTLKINFPCIFFALWLNAHHFCMSWEKWWFNSLELFWIYLISYCDYCKVHDNKLFRFHFILCEVKCAPTWWAGTTIKISTTPVYVSGSASPQKCEILSFIVTFHSKVIEILMSWLWQPPCLFYFPHVNIMECLSCFSAYKLQS